MKMANLAKFAIGLENILNWVTKVASWRVAIMKKMVNMTKIVKAAINGENGEKSSEGW